MFPAHIGYFPAGYQNQSQVAFLAQRFTRMAGLNSGPSEWGLTFQPAQLKQTLLSLNPENHVWESDLKQSCARDLSLFTYQGMHQGQSLPKPPDLPGGEIAAGKRNAGRTGSWRWETIRNWEGYEGAEG